MHLIENTLFSDTTFFDIRGNRLKRIGEVEWSALTQIDLSASSYRSVLQSRTNYDNFWSGSGNEDTR